MGDAAATLPGQHFHPAREGVQEGARTFSPVPPASFADSRLSVQFDWRDVEELGCAALADLAHRAGADSVQIERCDFYLDGEARAKALAALANAIRSFEEAGFPVAIWTSSLGYGPMTNPDFLRRFPNYQPLVAPEGAKAAVCATDVAWREAVAENVRDFIRAGAKTIIFDDDLVQACRPGVCCVCDEHRRRIAARLGVASVTAEQIRDAYAGSPNPLRSASLDALGESLMDFCRAMRAAADEVDPSATLATCLSISHFDLDGVDVPEMVRLLAGKNTPRPFARMSGATYWLRARGNARNWGQGLVGVVEFLRWQAALLREAGIVPMDENDPCPRDSSVVPAELVEAYDRAMIAEGGIVRDKYILRHNVKTGKGIDPAYLAAHLAGRDEAERIGGLFRDSTPVGFEIFAPPHLVRDADLPERYAGMGELLRLFAQPLAGILLTANGAPTRYDRDSGAPLAAFGPAAARLPEEWLARGVVLDRDDARILRARGIDTGGNDAAAVHRIDAWSLYRNAKGQAFAVCDKGWQELDCGETAPEPVPVRDIWRFFTGGEIPAFRDGAKRGGIIAKRRPDGTLAILETGCGQSPSTASPSSRHRAPASGL